MEGSECSKNPECCEGRLGIAEAKVGESGDGSDSREAEREE